MKHEDKHGLFDITDGFLDVTHYLFDDLGSDKL